MAKKATVQRSKEELQVAVNECNAQISALSEKREKALLELQEVSDRESENEAALFASSPALAAIHKAFAAVKSRLAALFTKSRTVKATISFVITPKKGAWLDLKHHVYTNDCSDSEGLVDWHVKAGEVTGEGLTKAQLKIIRENVSNYVDDMCGDARALFAPELTKESNECVKAAQKVKLDLDKLLDKKNLTHDVLEV